MGRWYKRWMDEDAVDIEITVEEASDILDRAYKDTETIMKLLKNGKLERAATPLCYVYYKPSIYEAEINKIKEHLDGFIKHVDGKGELNDMLSARIQLDKIVEHTTMLAQLFKENGTNI